MRQNEIKELPDYPLLTQEGEDMMDSDLFITVQSLVMKYDRDELDA